MGANHTLWRGAPYTVIARILGCLRTFFNLSAVAPWVAAGVAPADWANT